MLIYLNYIFLAYLKNMTTVPLDNQNKSSWTLLQQSNLWKRTSELHLEHYQPAVAVKDPHESRWFYLQEQLDATQNN